MFVNLAAKHETGQRGICVDSLYLKQCFIGLRQSVKENRLISCTLSSQL